MAYIIRVVGYNGYWTGSSDPGKLWSSDINEAYQFDNKEDPQKIVDAGQNMEVVEYSSAIPQIVELKASPDIQWDLIDKTEKEISARKAKKSQEDFVDLSSEQFDEDPNEIVEKVDIEVIE